ncbi:MAG TPA: hypothetical protein VK168_12990 [Saprospiraceae bacterium]|nr:hypothetical protein [Saprospiraceae bacterium]
MKHYLVIALFFNFSPGTSFAQLSSWFHDLKGCWLEDGRKTASFTLWELADDQTIQNSTYSLLCGDTILLYTQTVHFSEKQATLDLYADGKTQYFQLVSSHTNTLIWKNMTSNALPLELRWTLTYGKYLRMSTDNQEKEFTKAKQKDQSLHWTFGAALGGNISNYAHAITSNHFLTRNNIALGEGQTGMLGGLDFSFQFNLHSPVRRAGLSAELGLIQRNIGIKGSFFSKQAVNNREGYYRTNNLCAALIPTFYLDKHHRLALQTGFYGALLHRVQFIGRSSTSAKDLNEKALHNPENDIDLERGVLVGFRYKMIQTGMLKPQLFMRYYHGINSTHVRAFTLGLATDFQIR